MRSSEGKEKEFHCWCGNKAPMFPRSMKDCENGDLFASRIYSMTNSS